MFSEITRRQIKKFRSIRRAWWSFWILAISFFISLFSEHVANSRPLWLQYEGQNYFPTLKRYPGSTFGGPYNTEANYRELKESSEFQAKGGKMIFPLIPYSPEDAFLELEGAPPHRPSARHWLGTDEVARDVLSRLLYGYRICMSFAILLTIGSSILGAIIGGIQGYFVGWVDLTVQRAIEIWSALPFLYVAILIGSIYGTGYWTLFVSIGLFGWIALSYYMRGEFLRLREQQFVQAARALGARHGHIIWKQILPNALTPLITLLPFSIVGYITAITALDFLGFGFPPPTPSWGELLKQGLDNYLNAPWLSIFSVAALFITLLLASFVGEGARAAFDPKSSNRLE